RRRTSDHGELTWVRLLRWPGQAREEGKVDDSVEVLVGAHPPVEGFTYERESEADHDAEEQSERCVHLGAGPGSRRAAATLQDRCVRLLERDERPQVLTLLEQARVHIRAVVDAGAVELRDLLAKLSLRDLVGGGVEVSPIERVLVRVGSRQGCGDV